MTVQNEPEIKKKLASELYSMNYELATYSCADQLVKSSALAFIVGVAKHAQFRARGGATGSKGHELILLQGAILSQTMVLSRARHDF